LDQSSGKIKASEFQKVVDVNLKGSFLLAQQALRVMVPKRSGKIILVGSVPVKSEDLCSALFCEQRGVHSLARALAVEVAKKNIQINAVAPVLHSQNKRTVLSNPELKKSILSTIPMGRLGHPFRPCRDDGFPFRALLRILSRAIPLRGRGMHH